MLFDAPSNLAAITGPEATRDRISFFTLSVVSTAVQAGAIMTLIPLFEGLFSDNPASAIRWVGMLVGLVALGWGIDHISHRIGFSLGCRILKTVETSGVASIREMDISQLHSESASKLSKLLSTAGAESLSALAHLMFPLIQGVLITPLLSIFLLTISWKLAMVAFVTGVLLTLALVGSQRLIARSEAAYDDATRELNDATLEFAWAQPTLRTAGVSRSALDDVLRGARQRGLRLLLWQIPGETLFSIASQLGLLAFALVTGMLYLNSDISGATAAALIIVLLRIIEASGALSLLATPMSSMERTFRDIRALVDAADTSDSIPPTGTSSEAVDVQVSDVTYHYPDTTVGINSINLALPAGSITVVVGESGSGKSTLLDVLAGLRQHNTGSIAFNGTVLDAPNRLAHTSVMFQATELRQGTLRDNVTAADANADLDSIADQVQLVDILDKLPHGWDSTVGEGGSTLSGGERQRVGLARALAKNTGLLLVDEATSALDATNEQAIVDALGRLRGHRTMVIVTHRPALVSIADTVVVLKDGAIAENGTVSELIDKGGLFTHLWHRWQDVEQWTV